MTEHHTFPASADNGEGLEQALYTTLSLRRFGFKTRLATRDFRHGIIVYTVIATSPARPNREERGCNITKGEHHHV